MDGLTLIEGDTDGLMLGEALTPPPLGLIEGLTLREILGLLLGEILTLDISSKRPPLSYIIED
jgi:hypothetical protein